ncbi:hypothetical protein Leryth_010320 [Lithospermum erythrorhizon]|nr:hypothetical protein Leryth_010320 [Lithospermum erythrorhizon]
MVKSLDYWREYFRGANSDVFDIIQYAIMVAAIDCPKEFRLRRDHVAELLFTCKETKCFGCDRVELSVPKNGFDIKEEDIERGEISEFEKGGRINVNGEEMEVNANNNNNNNNNNVSYGEVEALTDEIEEESQLIAEVYRIKEILDHHQDESASILYESLRRLQLMGLSVEILKATEIGKSVNGLKKHVSKQIRDLVRTLIEGWVVMLDTWMSATASITDNTSPESVKTSTIDDEEGLPSPPLDEGAFFSHSIELSQIFDGMDDDGNPRNSGEFNKNHGSGRKPTLEDKSITKRKQQRPNDFATPARDKTVEQMALDEAVLKKASVVKPNKPYVRNPDSERSVKPSADQKVIAESKFQPKHDHLSIQKKPLAHQQNFNAKSREQQTDKGLIKKKPLPLQQEVSIVIKCEASKLAILSYLMASTVLLKQKSRSHDIGSIQLKLENAKRKLQERYQEAENAKRQRTIQVMELRDIPKQGAGRNPQMKPGHHNQNRNRANGRR